MLMEMAYRLVLKIRRHNQIATTLLVTITPVDDPDASRSFCRLVNDRTRLTRRQKTTVWVARRIGAHTLSTQQSRTLIYQPGDDEDLARVVSARHRRSCTTCRISSVYVRSEDKRRKIRRSIPIL